MSDKRDNPTIHGKSPVNAVDTFYNRSHGANRTPVEAICRPGRTNRERKRSQL